MGFGTNLVHFEIVYYIYTSLLIIFRSLTGYIVLVYLAKPHILARQEQPRLNQEENRLNYIFLNGIAGVVAKRRYAPRCYANNYNVHGANGKFVKL